MEFKKNSSVKIIKKGPPKQSTKKRDVTVTNGEEEIILDLTDQHILFCKQYLAHCMNGTKAAIAAGYSRATATHQASRLLRNEHIVNFIKMLQKDLGKRIGVTSDMIALELFKIGFSDLREFYNDSNSLKDIQELPDAATRVISAIEVSEEFEGTGKSRKLKGFTRKVKMYDKVKSLEILAKMIGVNGVIEDKDQTITININGKRVGADN